MSRGPSFPAPPPTDKELRLKRKKKIEEKKIDKNKLKLHLDSRPEKSDEDEDFQNLKKKMEQLSIRIKQQEEDQQQIETAENNLLKILNRTHSDIRELKQIGIFKDEKKFAVSRIPPVVPILPPPIIPPASSSNSIPQTCQESTHESISHKCQESTHDSPTYNELWRVQWRLLKHVLSPLEKSSYAKSNDESLTETENNVTVQELASRLRQINLTIDTDEQI
eukprot:GHVL01016766.1.p1 GENE.GHVL01016766.1~~GHVL01016766.1.p1  ORF type:complete len:222 (-),score=64.52 GHVL01016766.1:55-720(-)